MNRIVVLIVLFSILASSVSIAQYDDRVEYIDNYAEIAVREMHRTGIPASIKLAQAMLESNAGKSDLARKANNHFGIKCGSQWKGGTFHKKDDDYRGGRLVKSCFRRFKDPEASFIAHSKFLTDPDKSHRYGFLFEIDPTDYKRWARGLKRSGYATNPRYDNLLIDLIERYELYHYDKQAGIARKDDSNRSSTNQKSSEEKWLQSHEAVRTEDVIQIENEVEYVIARKGETIESIALQFNESERRLLKYNEGLTEADESIHPGRRIYLQRKRRNYRGRQEFHRVEKGETMFDIAQEYGLRRDMLYKRNRMEDGQQPAVGERIILRGKIDRDEVPKVRPQKSVSSKSPDSTSNQKRIQRHPIFDERLVLHEQPEQPTREEPSPPVQDESSEPPVFHKVQAGDTLYSIARQYQVTVEELKQLNQLQNNHLSVGQKLKLER